MDPFFTDSQTMQWENRNDNHAGPYSWLDQYDKPFSPYDLVEQSLARSGTLGDLLHQQQQPEQPPPLPAPEKEFASKPVMTALHGSDQEMLDDEADYMFRELKSFSLVQLVNKIRDLHNMTYELGVNEGLEMARAKLLNIFDEI